MTLRTILEHGELGSSVSSERPGTRPAVAKAVAAISRSRVVLGSFGIAVVAILALRWMVSESTPVVPSAGQNAASGPERQLEITVLGVHDTVAATASAVAPGPPVAVPVPAAAPAPVRPALAAALSSPRPNTAPRSAAATKATSRPAVAAGSSPGEAPRVEVAPATPPAQPDGPPLETNPYVYK